MGGEAGQVTWVREGHHHCRAEWPAVVLKLNVLPACQALYFIASTPEKLVWQHSVLWKHVPMGPHLLLWKWPRGILWPLALEKDQPLEAGPCHWLPVKLS